MPLEASFELGVLLVPAVISNDATAELLCAAGEALQAASLSSILDCIPAGPGPACWADRIYALGWGAFFYFFIFQNYFLQKYIFGFLIYRFIPLPPGCGAAGPLLPCCRAVGT